MFKEPIHIGPVQFDQPQWLLLLIPSVLLVLWWGRQSLSGLGTTSRRVALAVRIIVLVLLLGAASHPQWRRVAKNVTVTVVQDMSESVPKPLQQQVDTYVDDAAASAKPGDERAWLTVARSAYVQALPGPPRDRPDSLNIGSTDATNLAEALRLALAVAPGDKGNRILIASDGNETQGDLLSAANLAKSKGIPIDVLPLRYTHEKEVTVERIVVPSTARVGQNVNLRVLVNSREATSGRLTLSSNGVPIDLDPDSPADSRVVDVVEGLDAITVPLHLGQPGPQQYEAVFEPTNPADDSIPDNNKAMAVTFVSSEGRVLVLAPDEGEAVPLMTALRESKMDVEFRQATSAPSTGVEMASYDCIVMVNCRADPFSEDQQALLKSYVYDLGGGLVMVGGPDSFGAGGWTGSALADALPIKLDPPAKRQLPRGALMLIMHSCEMPNGNYWGKKVAESAVQNLTRLDLAGIIEAGWGGDTRTHPLSPVGNKSAIMRAINSMTYGDAPSFDGMFKMAYDDLVGAEAGAKHIIVISDGDPSLTNTSILPKFKAAKISVSTILVYPHNRQGMGFEWDVMRRIARETSGRFYPIIDQGDFAQLPSIFIKESTVVKRSLRWEGTPFPPVMTGALSEPLRGVTALPPVGGYIVSADREGLSVVSARGKENDPILAHWQFGLGKSLAFTSDAGARYASGWPNWGQYRQFWEQHVRWAMRPSGTGDIRVASEDLGDSTRFVVDALDEQGERLNFVRFKARVLGPDGSSQLVEMRQSGPGRYEGVFDSSRAGAYIANIQYAAPGPTPDAPPRQGNIQTAVTRPFAKEFKTLRDNAGLLRVVAERTGGRVLGADPKTADLWSRESLTMPVAQRPIWLIVAMIAIGLFLMDVAVRRVRFDVRQIAAGVHRLTHPARQRGGEQIGSLREARRRAQAGIKTRGDLTPEQRAAALAQVKAAARADEGTSRAKFEVGADELARSKSVEGMATTEAPVQIKTRKAAEPGEAPSKEEGLSRLRQAKQRARDELDEDGSEGGKKT